MLQERLALFYVLKNLAILWIKTTKILSRISAVKSSWLGILLRCLSFFFPPHSHSHGLEESGIWALLKIPLGVCLLLRHLNTYKILACWHLIKFNLYIFHLFPGAPRLRDHRKLLVSLKMLQTKKLIANHTNKE